MKKHLALLLMSALIPAASSAVRAQVFAKPTGSKAIPLRVQNLKAEVEIIGAVAITNWTMTVSMEKTSFGGWRGEGAVCDFICARPRDAKVTAFSINTGPYSDSKPLIARVQERGVVNPYVAFRAAKNDPLLRSGLNASNSFRATIYPLNNSSDATIRGTWVQSLTSSPTGATYRLPLLGLKGATTRLQEVDVKISARDGALPNLSNNYNLPFQTQEGTRVLTLNQKNYRVLKDLTLTFKRAKPTAGMIALVAPNPTTGGHFVFAFVADQPLKNFDLSGTGIEGAPTFSPKSVQTGQVVLATGTYSGDFKNLNVQLSADGLSKVDVVPIENAVAHSLWATQQINTLSARAKANRSQIIGLSKKYSVVSAFTSWLAIGDEDLKLYRRALVSSQLDPLVREYWMRIANGQSKSARVAQIKKSVTQISRGNGLLVEDELYARLGSAIGYAAVAYYHDNKQPYLRLEKEAERYRKRLVAQEPKVDYEELRAKIAAEYSKSHPDYAQLNQWERSYARAYFAREDPRLSIWRTRINAQNLEAQTTAAENANDTAQLAKLQKDRTFLVRVSPFTVNVGDPPIYVTAPANARQVVAIMPDGQIKTLDYNRQQKRWEGNYDVPVGTRDGEYKIQILVADANGSRHRYAMPFRVDTKAPSGKGVVEMASSSGESVLRLEVEHSGDVAVVSALMPWGEKVNLLPSTIRASTFFGSTKVPDSYKGKPIKATYILVDRAHNVTSIEAEHVSTSPVP